jgi:hypothetical protein
MGIHKKAVKSEELKIKSSGTGSELHSFSSNSNPISTLIIFYIHVYQSDKH